MVFNRIQLITLIVIVAGIILFFKKSSTNSIASETKLSIAFGSCSDEDKTQKLWPDILKEEADIWIWLGDNIYGDSEDPGVLRSKYDLQKSNEHYQKMIKTMDIHGIWDDHDYGVNDGGKEFPSKIGSQKALLDFLDVDADDPRRKRAGIYYDKLIEHKDLRVHMIFLDTRYFRDELLKSGNSNIANEEGTILGEVQWTWLDSVLSTTDADINLIASSIQAIPEEHRFEKWANFPRERERLFSLLTQDDPTYNIIISGDRHIGETSTINYNEKSIVEITSSSLTHGWSNKREEANKHRNGPIVYDENYGLLRFNKNGDSISYSGVIKSSYQHINSKIASYE